MTNRARRWLAYVGLGGSTILILYSAGIQLPWYGYAGIGLGWATFVDTFGNYGW